MEIGLINHWDLWFRPPMPRQCVDMKNGLTQLSKRLTPALTLKNLAGAFIVLLSGISISFLVHIYEKFTLCF